MWIIKDRLVGPDVGIQFPGASIPIDLIRHTDECRSLV